MNLDRIGIDCPLYEFDCSDSEFDIGEFYALSPNNGKLTLAHNGVSIGDFTANQQEDETINIVTPTSEDITNAVAGEALLREQADNTLQSNINAEQLARERADRDIQSVLDGESLARSNADIELQRQIDAIASKSDVVDVVANYAALQAYDTSKLNDNDVVKVLDDETHSNTMTYYRWNKASGTWSYIGQEAAYYSKSQMDTLLATKQDNLTAGTGIDITGTTISADTSVLATKSELANYAEKSDTYTKTEVDSLVEPKLSVEVVENLPATGEENKLYLTEKAKTIQTATGNPITATITDGAGKMRDFKLDGDTYQQTYSGKNLLDYTNANYPVSVKGITATLNADDSISVSGILTSSYAIFLSNDVTSELEDGATYTISSDSYSPDVYIDIVAYTTGGTGTFPANTRNGSASFTVNKSSFAKYLVRIQTYTVDSWGDTEKTITRKFQLEKNLTATSWEPYVGGQPSPNPDYPQAIQTVTGEQTVEIIGKNLFDKTSQISNGYTYSVTGTKDVLATSSVQESYISVLPSTTYTLHTEATNSQTTNFRVYICEYDSDKGFIKRDIPVPATSNTNTITTTENTHFVRLCFSTIGIDTLQFEKSASSTAYASYSKQTLPISLGSIELCKLGTYQDYIYKEGSDWKIHKETASYIFDGSESWAWDDVRIPRIYLTSGGLNSLNIHSIIPSSSAVLPTGMTSKFVPKTFSDFYTNSQGNGFAMSTTGQNFQIGDNKWASRDGAIADIVGVKWLYALATGYATDTIITDQTLITQLEAIRTASLENGSNTLSNSATGSNLAGDMEISYYGYNPTNRYDKWLWLDINNSYEQLGS